MNAFDSARNVERRSANIIRPLLSHLALRGQFVETDKGVLAPLLQRIAGDYMLNSRKRDGALVGIEVKAEEANKFSNFYFETWSNKQGGTEGWLKTLNAEFLLWHFVDDDELYTMFLPRVRAWLINDGNARRFPEKPQRKRSQLNDTWGLCVPIATVEAEVGYMFCRPAEWLRQIEEKAA